MIKDLLNKLTESACVTTVYHLRKQFVLTFQIFSYYDATTQKFLNQFQGKKRLPQ